MRSIDMVSVAFLKTEDYESASDEMYTGKQKRPKHTNTDISTLSRRFDVVQCYQTSILA